MMSRTFQTGGSRARRWSGYASARQFSTSFTVLKWVFFRNGRDGGFTEGFLDGLAIQRLADAGDDVGGVLVALEVGTLRQQQVA